MNQAYSIAFLVVLTLLGGCTSPNEENNDTESKEDMTILQPGTWRATLQLKPDVELPFNFEIHDSTTWMVFNADEVIEVKEITIDGDSIRIVMPVFGTYFKGKIENNKKIAGVWVNPNKKDYEIPFEATFGDAFRFQSQNKVLEADLQGKWKVTFSPESEEDSYDAIGEFRQEGKKLKGTFLTATGDYRFLEGQTEGNQLALSCFDGAHAFLFTAEINGDQISNGKFYSGKHWQEHWIAERNEDFTLPDMDTLTYLKEGYDKLEFTFKNTEGKEVSLSDPQFAGKVVIVQIMGSWCPNCMDETIFLVDLYEKYKDQGLEIIAIDYEIRNEFGVFLHNTERLRQDLGVEYTVLFGGPAKKSEAAKTLPMLNHILSYPTAIYIDRSGQIQTIQTGFTGPGTGEYYTNYVRETTEMVEKLLRQ